MHTQGPRPRRGLLRRRSLEPIASTTDSRARRARRRNILFPRRPSPRRHPRRSGAHAARRWPGQPRRGSSGGFTPSEERRATLLIAGSRADREVQRLFDFAASDDVGTRTRPPIQFRIEPNSVPEQRTRSGQFDRTTNTGARAQRRHLLDPSGDHAQHRNRGDDRQAAVLLVRPGARPTARPPLTTESPCRTLTTSDSRLGLLEHRRAAVRPRPHEERQAQATRREEPRREAETGKEVEEGRQEAKTKDRQVSTRRLQYRCKSRIMALHRGAFVSINRRVLSYLSKVDLMYRFHILELPAKLKESREGRKRTQ